MKSLRKYSRELRDLYPSGLVYVLVRDGEHHLTRVCLRLPIVK